MKRKVAYRSGYLVNRGGREIYVKYEDVIYNADLFFKIYVKKIYLSRVCVCVCVCVRAHDREYITEKLFSGT